MDLAVALASSDTNWRAALTLVAPVERLVLGEAEELWDDIAIAMYPSRGAMVAKAQPKMHEIGLYRATGLAGQLNIATARANGAWLGGPPGDGDLGGKR